jgi:hypothetical protein
LSQNILEGELVIFFAILQRELGISLDLAQGWYLMIGDHQQK